MSLLLFIASMITLWHRGPVQAPGPRKRDILVWSFPSTYGLTVLKHAFANCRWEYFTSLDFELKVLDKRIDRKLPIILVIILCNSLRRDTDGVCSSSTYLVV